MMALMAYPEGTIFYRPGKIASLIICHMLLMNYFSFWSWLISAKFVTDGM
jgi:hypothetical protein